MSTILILTILAVLAYELILKQLNYSYRNQSIPANVRDVYDKKDYKKWLSYYMEGHKLSIIESIFNSTIFIAFLALGIFPSLAEFAGQFTDNPILNALIFLAVFMFINYVLNIGFTIYRTFSIEERYGFNTTTVKTFVLDQFKNMFFTALIGGGIIYVLLVLFDSLGFKAIFYSWVLLVGFVGLIQVLYARVFIKFFNKLTPLEDGDLKNKCQELAHSLGFEIKSIYIMDASKRTTKSNAFFSGFGKLKTIVLYDNLVNSSDTDEIVSVLAHEIGHSLNKDTLKGFIRSAIMLGVFVVILAYIMTSISLHTAFGFESISYGFAIILFEIILSPINTILSIPFSMLSRKAEFKADAVAKKAGYGPALIRSLKNLARENFANLTPHPFVVKCTYSHPPVHQRIDALNKD